MDEKRKRLQEPILADGETTGHAHRVISEKPVEVYELDNGLREFLVEEPVTIVHEEHGKIEIPTGEYTSGIVREYDHFAEEARRVID